MNRRQFVRLAGSAGTGLLFSSIAHSESEIGRNGKSLDRYGGWTGKKLGRTGFFHTKRDESRWWFVTPEGNAFLSFGINHYHDSWWEQEYNRDYWVNAFGAHHPRDELWNEGFRTFASADLKRLGINTLGMHTNASMLTDRPFEPVVPYLRSYKPLVLDHYIHPGRETYVDIFDQGFETLCDETARSATTGYADDPMLLGYCMSDCPIFTDEDVRLMGGVTTWPRVLRNLGARAPEKQVYVETVKNRYGDIGLFNRAYGMSFGSWTDLAEAENWRPEQAPVNAEEQADNESFMLVCVDRYYSVSSAALRRDAPNHLFFGDKLNGNSDNLGKVLDIAARYADVILYQFYDHWSGHEQLLDTISSRVDIPCVNGDTGFSVPGETMPNPHGPHADDQAERAEWLTDCCRRSFACPAFIGWHMCGIIDTWKTMPGKEHSQHQGLMTVTGEYYSEMESAVRDISRQLYLSASPQFSLVP